MIARFFTLLQNVQLDTRDLAVRTVVSIHITERTAIWCVDVPMRCATLCLAVNLPRQQVKLLSRSTENAYIIIPICCYQNDYVTSFLFYTMLDIDLLYNTMIFDVKSNWELFEKKTRWIACFWGNRSINMSNQSITDTIYTFHNL